jgi:hypothetical protein
MRIAEPDEEIQHELRKGQRSDHCIPIPRKQ